MTASSPLSGVAARYAGALFDLCDSAQKVKTVEADLDGIGQSLKDSPDFMRLIQSPVFSADEQVGAIDAILKKGGVGELTGNFIRVVAKNRRLFALPGMVEAFKTMAAEARGEVSAEVTSAIKLTAEDRDALKAALKDKVGKNVALNETVDPSILGGLIVKVGSRMIDTSIRTKLTSLKMMMKEVG